MRNIFLSLLSVVFFACSSGDNQDDTVPAERFPQITIVNQLDQQTFPTTIPAGNYSGITWLGDDKYAVANDKSEQDGYCLFHLDIDKSTGKINTATSEGLISNKGSNRDSEGIVYVPSTKTLFISGEADNKILEYNMDGSLTGRSLTIPAIFSHATSNYGFESLAYHATTKTFWTTTESTLTNDGEQATATNLVQNRLRIQSFNQALQSANQYAYRMEAPISTTAAKNYAMGVSDITALSDGRLIILEREFYVPSTYFGAFVNCVLFLVNPVLSTPISATSPLTSSSPYMEKTKLCEFKTPLESIANYEGMCLGPDLDDGTHTLILCSDSQNQYKGVLKDYFKVITFK